MSVVLYHLVTQELYYFLLYLIHLHASFKLCDNLGLNVVLDTFRRNKCIEFKNVFQAVKHVVILQGAPSQICTA